MYVILIFLLMLLHVAVKGEDEDDEDDEFHDALGDQVEEWCFTTPPSTVNKGHR